MVPVDEFMEVIESGHFLETSAVACVLKALVRLKMLTSTKM
jgi:hypothetical protein